MVEGAVQKLTDDSQPSRDPFVDAESRAYQKAYDPADTRLQPDDSRIEKDRQAEI
jgi:hypothetical protein